MNTAALLTGLIYGILTITICYFISLITAGLFGRSFYKTYARILISICSVMLAAPGLLWIANQNVLLAVVGLNLSHYAVMLVLGYGIIKFNREHLKSTLLDRQTLAYFTFGTLAYATVITLGFLHLALAGRSASQNIETLKIHAHHYGPLLVLLSALVLHTDYHLKQSVGNLRRFSYFTFVGYFISFLGIAFATAPYLGKSLNLLGITNLVTPPLLDFFSGQALLIAIFIYAWLVYRYESIPPLFLLLLAIIGEYHVLVTQWVIQTLGIASWGIASLPLAILLASLDHYFSLWDIRKLKAAGINYSDPFITSETLRFALPFRLIAIAFAVALFSITLWTRFNDTSNDNSVWLMSSFGLYALFFIVLSVYRKVPSLLYASGLLTALMIPLGMKAFNLDSSLASLGIYAATLSTLAIISRKIGLKQKWQTPIADCGLIAATATLCFLLFRTVRNFDFYISDPYANSGIIAASGIAISFATSAFLYRSRLPVYALLLSCITIYPPLTTPIVALLASLLAVALKRTKMEPLPALDYRLQLFDSFSLPLPAPLPSLFYRPLFVSSIPIGILGILFGLEMISRNVLSPFPLLGLVAVAVSLSIDACYFRKVWIYILAVTATYLSIHAIAHQTLVAGLTEQDKLAAHLLVTAVISLTAWIATAIYATWCDALLSRVSEAKESEVQANRFFFVEPLRYFICTITIAALAISLSLTYTFAYVPILLFSATTIFAVLLILSASVFRLEAIAYIALSALSLVAFQLFSKILYWEPNPVSLFAILGLIAATMATVAAHSRQTARQSAPPQKFMDLLLYNFLKLDTRLWQRPFAISSLICTIVTLGLAASSWSDALKENSSLPNAHWALLLTSGSLFLSSRIFRNKFLYVSAIAFCFTSAHLYLFAATPDRNLVVNNGFMHLALTSLLSLICCCIAAVSSLYFNSTRNVIPSDLPSNRLWDREFYSGILLHFGFTVSFLALTVFSASAFLNQPLPTKIILVKLLISLLLTITFLISGIAYRSQIPFYSLMISIGLGCHSAAFLLEAKFPQLELHTIVIASLAIATSVIAWFSASKRETDSHLLSCMLTRIEVWQSPPLPLAFSDRSLWLKPLIRSAMGFAIVSVLIHASHLIGITTLPGVNGLSGLPIFLAAFAMLLVATSHATCATGSDLTCPEKHSNSQRNSTNEAWFSYILCMVSLIFAIHFTFHTQYLSQVNLEIAFIWHPLIAVVIALSGWGIATFYNGYFLTNLLVNDHSQQLDNTKRMYGDALYHISLVLAFASLLFITIIYFLDGFGYLPLIGTSLLLTIFFGLAAITYRSKFISYVGCLCLGIFSVQFSLLSIHSKDDLAITSSVAIAFLSLALAILDRVTTMPPFAARYREIISHFPSPWPNSSENSGRKHLFEMEHSPILNSSIAYSLMAVALTISNKVSEGDQGIPTVTEWISFSATAMTFLIAAWQYRTSFFSYLAVAMGVLSIFPFTPLQEPDMQLIVNRGIFVSVILALASYLLEFFSSLRNRDESPSSASHSLHLIYTRPFIYCSSLLAFISMLGNMTTIPVGSWMSSTTNFTLVELLGTIALLLNAKMLSSMQSVPLAKLLVYTASSLFALGTFAVVYSAFGTDYLAITVALLSLLETAIGFSIIELPVRSINTDSQSQEWRQNFGSPFVQIGSGLTVLAIGIVAYTFLNHCFSITETFNAESLQTKDTSSLLFSDATALLLVSMNSLLLTRSFKTIAFFYTAILCGFFGALGLLEYITRGSGGTLVVFSLLLSNTILVIARIYSARRKRFSELLDVSESDASNAFHRCAFLLAAMTMVLHSASLAYVLTDVARLPSQIAAIWAIPLCLGFYLQLFYLRPSRWHSELLVIASIYGCLILAISSHFLVPLDITLALLAIFWGTLAAILPHPAGDSLLRSMRLPNDLLSREKGELFLRHWSCRLLLFSLIESLIQSQIAPSVLPTFTITIVLCTIAAIIYAVRWKSVPAIAVASSLLPLCLLSAVYHYGGIQVVFEQTPLVLSMIAATYLASTVIVSYPVNAKTPPGFHSSVYSLLMQFSQLLSFCSVITAVLGVMQFDLTISILISLVLSSLTWIGMTLITGREVFAYPAFIGILFSLLGGAHAFAGLEFINNPLSSLIVLLFCIGLYTLNLLAGRWTSSGSQAILPPTYYLALSLPSLMIFTIPWKQPAYGALELLAAAAFYILISKQKHIRVANYIAAVLVNIATYIWLPFAREFTGLYQLYVIPVALTVLIFAQLHRQDLKPKVLSGIRMAASGAILAVSSYEVLFASDPSLLNFVIALILSLIGVTFGIALRVKPFVYVGIAFLLLNVSGQIIMQFQREGGVIRAVILIVVGLTVLAAMIFFNIHRERILKNYRTFQMKWE